MSLATKSQQYLSHASQVIIKKMIRKKKGKKMISLACAKDFPSKKDVNTIVQSVVKLHHSRGFRMQLLDQSWQSACFAVI